MIKIPVAILCLSVLIFLIVIVVQKEVHKIQVENQRLIAEIKKRTDDGS